MLKTTFIARASDGRILCESYEDVTDPVLSNLKLKTKKILQNINQTQENCQITIDRHHL